MQLSTRKHGLCIDGYTFAFEVADIDRIIIIVGEYVINLIDIDPNAIYEFIYGLRKNCVDCVKYGHCHIDVSGIQPTKYVTLGDCKSLVQCISLSRIRLLFQETDLRF